MRRIILYIGILALVIAAPVKPMNIGDLRPVQIVSVYKEGGWTVIETDTDDKGIGGTALQALQNMKDASDGVIYLDTADYLLLTKDAEEAIMELYENLKPSVRLCMVSGAVNLKKAASYLKTHGALPKLKGWKKGTELPVLSTFGNSLIFLKKVENNA